MINILEVAEEELYRIYDNEIPHKVFTRYNEEIEIIKVKQIFNIYLLAYLVSNKIREYNIPYFPKGAVSSSYIAYLLKISNINPIKYNFPYEVFIQTKNIPYFEIAIPSKYVSELEKYIEELTNKINFQNERKYINVVPSKSLDIINISNQIINKYKNIEELNLYELLIRNNEIVPEDKRDLTKNILSKITPKSIEDFVNILGIIEGTNIWENNIENLIDKYNLADLPITRDDVYIKLINKGIDKILAYEIMNFVTTGKQTSEKYLTQWNKYIEIMREYNIEEWYINVLKKVKYMFPKAHCCNLAMIYNIYDEDV